MVIDSGLKNAIRRNKIIKQFCSMRENKPCLAGIQYDIEPYVLKEYNQDANHFWQLWNNAIEMKNSHPMIAMLFYTKKITLVVIMMFILTLHTYQQE